MRVYFDTNIWVNYLKGTKIDSVVAKLLSRCMDCEFELVFSDWAAYELKKCVEPEKVKFLFAFLQSKNKIITVLKSEEDVAKAKERSEHFQDILHAILAKKAGADVLLTRNIRDFACCRDLIKAELPEHF